MKSYLKNILIVLSTTLSWPMFGLYKLYERPTIYQAGVNTIDTGASAMSRFVTWFDYVTRRRETPTQKSNRVQAQRQVIDRRLAQIEENLRIEEKQTIANLYRSLGLNANQIKEVNAYMQEQTQFVTEYMSGPHKKAQSDYILNKEFLPLFEKAHVHPESVKIEQPKTSTPGYEQYSGVAHLIETKTINNSSKKRLLVLHV